MSTNAFTKTGNTVVFTAAVTAPTPVQALSTTLGGNQYRIINSGLVTVFLGYGTVSGDATNSATVVTSTGPAYPILAGTDEILTFVPNAYFTGITSSSTAVVYITPGDGM
jgi:Na+/phosphate symporter